MRLHIGKAFNSLKLTDYLEEEDARFHCIHSSNNVIRSLAFARIV